MQESATSAARAGVSLAVVALSMAGAALPARAASAPPPLAVLVHDASGLTTCPSAELLTERIRASSGGERRDEPGDSSERVFVSFALLRGGVEARVSTTHSGEKPRELFEPSGDCASLTEAVVLIATLLLAPSERSRGGSSPVESSLERETPSPAVPAPSAAPIVAPPSPERRGVAVPPAALGATLLMTSGVLPELQWGVGLDSRWALVGRFSLKAGADYLPVVEISRASQAYRFSRSSARVGVSWSLLLTRSFRLDVDAAALLGITHVAVIGDRGVEPGDFLYPGFRGGWSGSFAPASWLLGFAGLHVELPVLRNVFRSENVPDPIWSQPWIGLSAEVGFAWRAS